MTEDDEPLEPDPLPTVEQAVLGACFLDAAACSLALDHLRPEHFEGDDAARVFRAISRNDQRPADLPIVVDEMRADPANNGAALYARNCLSVPTAANQPLYVARLLRAWMKRTLELGHAKAAETWSRPEGERLLAEAEAVRVKLLKPLGAAAREAPSDSWDFADMAAEEDDPPPDEFVSRLFVRPSFNMVFGPPQAGKSWAVMALCLDAVMGGGNFLGCEELYVKPLREIRDGRDERVLWVFGSEDTRARVKRRLKTLHASGPHAGKDVPRGAFVVATPPGGLSIHLPEGWAWLLKKIEEVDPTVVVFDTISSLTGNSLDVNKAEQVIPFISKINALRAEKNLVVFGLHHTRKGSSDPKKTAGNQADAMLGAGAWRALSEGVLMLDAPDGDTSKVSVVSVKAKDIDRPIPKLLVSLESPGGRFRQLDDDEQAAPREEVARAGRKRAVTAEQILDLRTRFPDGLPWRDIPGLLDVVPKTWRNNSARLQDEVLKLGHVVIVGVLKWT